MSITDFLLARIAEDEAVARAAIEDDGGSDGGFSKQYDKLIQPPSGIGHAQGGFGEAAARMIATYAVPARVLAECEAKRAIVEMHQPMKDDGWVSGESHWYLWCSSCGSVDYDSPVPYPCDTIRTLAAIYADHPDYLDEWRVTA